MSDHPDAEWDPQVWLARAKSCLTYAKVGHGVPGVFLEDLCLQLEQAAEKAFKGLLIARSAQYPRSHSISKLMTLIGETGLPLPESLDAAMDLTSFAVRTRYPGGPEVTEEDYTAALNVAEAVVAWVSSQIGTGK